MSKNYGIILISHGSSLPYGEVTFNEIKDKFINKTGLPTEVGYMKVSSPSIAGDTNIDIPILLGLDPLEKDPRCPDGNYPDEHYLSIADDVDFNGEIELLPPIGPDDDLLKFIDKRIEELLSESELDEDAKTGVLIVSHGSRLKYNKEFTSELFSKFEKTTDYPCSFGFMELEEPSIPEAIDALLDENEIDRLIVMPIFIAPGVHTTNDIPTILGLKEGHSHEHHHDHDHGHSHGHDHHHDLTTIDFDGEILYPEPIKADDVLIDILVKKVNDAL